MKATREASIKYGGSTRTVYRLSEPLTDRTYPFIDSLTGVLRFERPDLVMVWGMNGEHLNVCGLDCQVRDFTPIVADYDRIVAAIRKAGGDLPGARRS